MVKVFKLKPSIVKPSLHRPKRSSCGNFAASLSVVEQTFMFTVCFMSDSRWCHDYVMIIKHPHALEIIILISICVPSWITLVLGEIQAISIHSICISPDRYVCVPAKVISKSTNYDTRINRNTSVTYSNCLEHEYETKTRTINDTHNSHNIHFTYPAYTWHVLNSDVVERVMCWQRHNGQPEQLRAMSKRLGQHVATDSADVK